MAYDNRSLMRDPLCMIRVNHEEREKLLRLANRLCDGGAPAVTLREALLKLADEVDEGDAPVRRHEGNASHGRRLDRNVFGGLLAA